MTDNIIKQPPLPDTIHFNHTRDNDKTEVMRITRNGVWVNPDMAVDETAQAVLDALDYQVKVLVQRAVEAEREKVAKWMMVQGYATGHGDTVEDLLKELGWQVAPVDAVNMSQERVDETAKGEHDSLGSEWVECVKLPIVVHVRKQRDGETHISTREGITPVLSDDLIMRGVAGEEYPIGRELFERTYTFDTAPPKREWVGLTDEDIAELRRNGAHSVSDSDFMAIEAKLKEKNA